MKQLEELLRQAIKRQKEAKLSAQTMRSINQIKMAQ